MAYNRIGWVNNETELNAQNFNHVEDGIVNNINVKLIAINDTAPAQCSTGDKYFNKTTKKIYTAVDTNTWGDTGSDPLPDIIYIVFSKKGTYSYDGDTLVSVGGGSGAYIGTETPPIDDNSNLWINPDDVVTRQDNMIKTNYNESDDSVYSTNYINDISKYSTTEIKTNKKWVNNNFIYRKVIHILTLNDNTTRNIAHNISNLAYITDLTAMLRVGTTFYKSDYINENDKYIKISADQTNVVVASNNNWGENSDGYVILEYTKTTEEEV